MKRILFAFLLLFSVSIFAQKIQNQTVDAACAMCQFKVKTDKGCAMAVKINGKVFVVEGINKKEFGEMHSDDGYCKIMKKAVDSGEIKKGKFYATSFKYVD